MDFDYSPKTKELQARLLRFMDEHIYPNEARYKAELEANTAAGKRWTPLQLIEELKPKARAAGPVEPVPAATAPHASGYDGAGLSNQEYAPLCRDHGPRAVAPRGLQLLGARHRQHGDARALRHATSSKARWLEPLLDGEIRSRLRDDRAGGRLVGRHQHRSPASSARATTTSSTAASGGSRGAGDPRCEIFIIMGKTDPEAPRHSQQSMIAGAGRHARASRIVRPLQRVRLRRRAARPRGDRCFENVRVPVGNILLGEGRGFEIAQGRLGPGRIHHCMRLIGAGRARAGADVQARLVSASRSARPSPQQTRDAASASPRRAARSTWRAC